MSLFKSAEERRIERDIKIRQGIRRIEKSVAEQNKFTDEFIKNARRAKEIGDEGQYVFISRRRRWSRRCSNANCSRSRAP